MAKRKEDGTLVISLTLNDNEDDRKVIIGGNVEIDVVECSKFKVKLSITAPKHIAIWRKRLWKEIQHKDFLHRQRMEAEKNSLQSTPKPPDLIPGKVPDPSQ